MNRQDFIFTLFNNGNGLTLDQIRSIDDGLIDTVPDGFIEDLMNNNGMDKDEATNIAIHEARQVFMNRLRDTADMLDLRSFINESLPTNIEKVNDMQVSHLWYVTREV